MQGYRKSCAFKSLKAKSLFSEWGSSFLYKVVYEVDVISHPFSWYGILYSM